MIKKFKHYLFINIFSLLILITPVYADNHNVSELLETIQKDLKTLEKAVYANSSDNELSLSSNTMDQNSEEVLTRHLLKLSEIENQFQDLTNKFEEINFKLDKLSSRVTKIQSDNQLRFSDLENLGNENKKTKTKTKKVLPGSSQPADFGANPGYSVSNLPEEQQTSSIESAQTVILEEAEKRESLLPDKPPQEQYEFAVSFMKIGDYETAEFALKEFIDKNKDHDLAGSAQYWYGETFRIRQLYSDAATAYLDGYQNYPKSNKAPDNLLKLGITMVQLGEKDQGCKMISGIKKEYPKANKSVLQKAQYEQKKFKCKS